MNKKIGSTIILLSIIIVLFLSVTIASARDDRLSKEDLFIDNGACFQWIPKDNSPLPWEGWRQRTSLVVPKTKVKKLMKELKEVQSDRYPTCKKYMIK